MAYINVKNIYKNFVRIDDNGTSSVVNVLNDVTFGIEKGEFVCLLGFSGCGKSTLLNLLAGFEQPTRGTIEIDGKVVSKPSPNYITIFQHYGLLPWKNVLRNVELGLESESISKEQRESIARHYLGLVGLKGYENQFPAQLSGGQQQRVAIARGLAVNPDILFMDEPFGALDPIIRSKLQDDLLKIVHNQNKTVIFVTHDIDEAVYLADRVFVMKANPGHIEEIYNIHLDYPRNRNDLGFNRYHKLIYDKLYSIQEKEVEYFI